MLEARNDLKNRAKAAGGAGGGSGNERIGLAGHEHHGRIVARVFKRFARFGASQAFDAADLLQLGGERLKVFAALGLDDTHALKIDVELGGGGLDEGAVAQQNGHTHAASDPLPGGLKNAGIAAFRENDALGVALEFLYELGDNRHKRSAKLSLPIGSVNAGSG